MILIELEALFQFILSFKALIADLEIDRAARPFVFVLASLGVIKLSLISLMAYYGIRQLNNVILNKSYHSNIFGSVHTFFSDFIIIQLYFYTAYIYDYSLPLVLLISCVSYIYYKFVRA